MHTGTIVRRPYRTRPCLQRDPNDVSKPCPYLRPRTRPAAYGNTPCTERFRVVIDPSSRPAPILPASPRPMRPLRIPPHRAGWRHVTIRRLKTHANHLLVPSCPIPPPTHALPYMNPHGLTYRVRGWIRSFPAFALQEVRQRHRSSCQPDPSPSLPSDDPLSSKGTKHSVNSAAIRHVMHHLARAPGTAESDPRFHVR